MKRMIREVALVYTQAQADDFTPSISPEALPYILSSVVREGSDDTENLGVGKGTIKKYPIHTLDGSPEVYQGAYIYPYWGVQTMYAHVEVVFDEVPLPHESVLKWCALSMKAGPISAKARANQLVVVQGNHLHYLWRVLSVEEEAALSNDRSLDITNLHLWRWVPPYKWVCGRTSVDTSAGEHEWTLITSRATSKIDCQALSYIPDGEPVHKLYMALLGENLL